jgi:hypothetical protein
LNNTPPGTCSTVHPRENHRHATPGLRMIAIPAGSIRSSGSPVSRRRMFGTDRNGQASAAYFAHSRCDGGSADDPVDRAHRADHERRLAADEGAAQPAQAAGERLADAASADDPEVGAAAFVDSHEPRDRPAVLVVWQPVDRVRLARGTAPAGELSRVDLFGGGDELGLGHVCSVAQSSAQIRVARSVSRTGVP